MKIFNTVAFRNLQITKKILPNKQISKSMEITNKPIISNIKSWYRDAGEKLNDIYLEQTTNKTSTYVSKFNKDAYDALPQVIKDALHPSDVSYNGHIDQSRINELWDAAQKAHKQGVYGRAPIFRGNLEDLQDAPLNSMPSLEMDNVGMDLASHVGELSEHLDNHVETTVELINNAHDHGSTIIEHLTDLLG